MSLILTVGMGPSVTLELIAPTEVLTQNPSLLPQIFVCHMISVGLTGEHELQKWLQIPLYSPRSQLLLEADW